MKFLICWIQQCLCTKTGWESRNIILFQPFNIYIYIYIYILQVSWSYYLIIWPILKAPSMLYTEQQNILLAYTKWTWCFFLKRVHCALKQEKSFCDLIPMPAYCIKSFTGNGKVRATKEDKATTRMEKSFFTSVVWKEGDGGLGSEQVRTIMIVVWNRLRWVGDSIAFSFLQLFF